MRSEQRSIDPALNLLHNENVMHVLRETMDKLAALGMSCALIPGGPRPRDDEAMQVSLLVAPHDDALLDLRAADSIATDFAGSVEGHKRFIATRAFLLAEDEIVAAGGHARAAG